MYICDWSSDVCSSDLGVVALEALGRRDGDAALLDDGAVFQRLGFGVIFIIFADVFLDGELDGVVHLGGQHLIGRAVGYPVYDQTLY